MTSMDRKTTDRWLVGESWVGSEIQEHLQELCLNIGARWASSPGERRAAEYITGQFGAYGLAEPHTDEFPLDTWECDAARGEIVETQMRLDIVPFHFCPSCSIESPIVDAGYGTPYELAAAQESLKGAAAIMNLGYEPFTPPRPLADRLVDLATQGVSAVIVVESKSGRRMEYHNGSDWRDCQRLELPLPVVTTSREHGAELRWLASNHSAVRF